MKILLSGGTGFVGKALLAALERDPAPHEVTCLTRHPGSARSSLSAFPRASVVAWDPMATEPSEELIRAVAASDAVVHLAGEPLFGTRLGEEKKQRVLSSRVTSTALLVRAIGQASPKPHTFLCASAIGYYGDAPGGESLDESSPPGNDFLAEVCLAWEGAAKQVDPGVRLVRGRIGVVLGKGGGALEKMALPIKLFVGGRIGSGEQVVSWISEEDIARALLFCLQSPDFVGAVNLTAPHPVKSAELTRQIGKLLHRPTVFPVPRLALQAVFGDGAEVLLSGQRVLPQRLLDAGFTFHHPDLNAALQHALG